MLSNFRGEKYFMMADDNDCSYPRESYVCVSAVIQGNLERKKGVLGGRSKHWCSLQGSTLYLQKKQGDVMETIDMRDVHHVRKTSNEYTGTHFEICIKKRNHVFICPSSEICTAWVIALQNAIAQKDKSHQSSSASFETSVADDRNVYNEVDEALVSAPETCKSQFPEIIPCRPAKIADYTEPEDKENVAVKKENEYWEVGDVKNNLPQSVSEQGYDKTVSLSQVSSGPIYDDAESVMNAKGSITSTSNCQQENFEDHYSQIQKEKKTSDAEEVGNVGENLPQSASGQGCDKTDSLSQVYFSGPIYEDAESVINAESAILRSSNCQPDNIEDHYSKVQKIKKTSGAEEATDAVPVLRVTGSGDNAKSSSEFLACKYPSFTSESDSGPSLEQEDQNLFQILLNALTDRSSPVQDYIHPLTEEDRIPVEKLSEFLSSNREVCRVSYSLMPVSDDPVSSLKSYLGKLDLH